MDNPPVTLTKLPGHKVSFHTAEVFVGPFASKALFLLARHLLLSGFLNVM
jgi:hypothetical protein